MAAHADRQQDREAEMLRAREFGPAMAVVVIVGVGLALCAPAGLGFGRMATASSDSATVRLEPVRWTEWLRGRRTATLTLADRQGIGVIVPAGDLSRRLGSQQDRAELRELLGRMSDRELEAA
jgi:hypothetical protein